jgi:pimeloyl-ACP methyl ester carboxylesterase
VTGNRRNEQLGWTRRLLKNEPNTVAARTIRKCRRMKKLMKICLAGIFSTLPLAVSAQGLSDRLDALGAKSCEDSSFQCVTLDVPLDHFANDPEQTLPITFAVSLASEPSEGILFYAVGGPGGSGLASAESYLSAFEPDIQSRLDIVMFDQRGVGAVHGLSCPVAQGAFDRSGASIKDEPALLATVQTFVAECQTELKRPDILPYVGTSQAIRDLELFRQAIGAPKVWFYGESYGTQFAQSYATAFPDAVKGVILDGVVDLNLSENGFYTTYSTAAEKILTRLFAACDALHDCASDMGDATDRVYSGILADMKSRPTEVDFPLIDGSTSRRTLTEGMVETNAFFALYSPEARTAFLRALASAGRGDAVPMLRQAYANLYIDPETEIGFSDPAWFGAAYFAINCLDYGDGAGTPDADAQRILAQTRDLAPQVPRLLRSYYLERLVCAYWPQTGQAKRPDPFAGSSYPTLILNSDTDPITSVSMAYSVLDHVQNGAAVIMQGGPHVIWGRGKSCPDVTVARLIFEGALPSVPVQVCQQEFLAPYTPLTKIGNQHVSAYDLGHAIETELSVSPDFADWPYSDVLEFSCNHGGRIKAFPTDMGAALQFTGCQMWPGITLYGNGSVDMLSEAQHIFELKLDVLGPTKGHFTYTSDHAAGTSFVTGTLDGKPVETPRPVP